MTILFTRLYHVMREAPGNLLRDLWLRLRRFA